MGHHNLKQYVKVIRGQNLLLDRDLAVFYGVTAEKLRRTVRKESQRFPPDFMVRLTPAESGSFRRTRPGRPDDLPSYAFTKLGCFMLASVLQTPKAVGISKIIARSVRMFP